MDNELLVLEELNYERFLFLHDQIVNEYKLFIINMGIKEGDFVTRSVPIYEGHDYKKDIFKVVCIKIIETDEYDKRNKSIVVPLIRINCNKCHRHSKKQTKGFYDFQLNELELYIEPKKEELVTKKVSSTYVYLIEAGDLYKIGFSNNPSSRLKGIQTHNPYKCSILYKIKDPFGTLEKDLHAKFNSLRINGEWFKKSDLIIGEFERLTKNEHQVSDKLFTLFPISA